MIQLGVNCKSKISNKNTISIIIIAWMILIVMLSSSHVDAFERTFISSPQEPCAKVEQDSILSIHFRGFIIQDKINNGNNKDEEVEFDSTYEKGEPIEINIREGLVIKGFIDGLMNICEGTKLELIIPPEEGYGSKGIVGVIPGGATLKYIIEIIKVRAPNEQKEEEDLFTLLDEDKDNYISKAEAEKHFKKQGLDGIPEHLWIGEDKNGDGRISFNEFTGVKKGRNAFDTLSEELLAGLGSAEERHFNLENGDEDEEEEQDEEEQDDFEEDEEDQGENHHHNHEEENEPHHEQQNKENENGNENENEKKEEL